MRTGEAPLQDESSFGARVFHVAVAAALAYLLYRILAPFLAPIVWAFLLAFLLFPVTRRVRRLVGGRRGLAAGVLILGVMVCIIGPALAVTAAFVRQAAELVPRLSAVADRYQIGGVRDILKLPVIGGAVAWIEAHFAIDAERIHLWAVQGLQAAVQFLLSHSGAAVAGALGVLADLALMLFVLFFFFRDGDAMAARAIEIVPMEAGRKERLTTYLNDVTWAVVVGTIITALVQGALIGVAFWITGFSSPVVFGALATVASFVPFVGTGLVVAPAVLFLLSQGVVWKTLFMLVWGVVVAGSADNFLRPLLISGRVQIGTLTVLFGVLGGLAAFGMIGLFVGPVILALVLSLLNRSGEESEGQSGPEAPA
jgi:predicted PurR-regulated permease PerM